MNSKYPIILASQSPRRKELLSYLELDFNIKALDADETPPLQLTYDKWAEDIATRKAAIAFDLVENTIIIAADTMVFLNGDSYGKPDDEEDAREMLEELGGKEHEVITGVAVFAPNLMKSFSVTTLVRLEPLSNSEIDFYIKKYKPLDKAGAYGIQDWMGMVKVSKLTGSYTNVMGLPLAELENCLKENDLIH